MSDQFLPDDYQGVPEEPGNYLNKFEEGENPVRALSSVITGWVYWTGKEPERKPVRVKKMEDVPDQYRNNKDNRENAKYFWALAVYNFKTKSIQIMEIKQKGIMNAIEDLVKNDKWGNPKAYNIVINKKKTGSEARDVEYTVMPEPKEELDKGIVKLYEDMHLDLQALFRGDDPFSVGDTVDPDDVPENLGEKNA